MGFRFTPPLYQLNQGKNNAQYGPQPDYDGYAVTAADPATITLLAANTETPTATWVAGGALAVGEKLFGPGIPDNVGVVSGGTLALPASTGSGTINVSQFLNLPSAVTAYAIPAANVPNGPTKALYVTGAGNVQVLLPCGATALLSNVPAGWLIPISVLAVFATNTTATGIYALY